MERSRKFIVVISGLVVITILWIFWVSTNSSGENPTLVEYLTIEELKADFSDARVKLGGTIKPGSIDIDESDLLSANFVMEQGDQILPVHYYGTRPDLFKDEIEVIVEGTYNGELFIADQLQTKCASRYEGDLRDESTIAEESL
jgi:cytochrome c-type biogenesis protein CcmE